MFSTTRRRYLQLSGLGAAGLSLEAFKALGAFSFGPLSSGSHSAHGAPPSLSNARRAAADSAKTGGDGGAAWNRAKACIVLFMDGGPSHIDLFDRKPSAPSEIRGPFGSISTSVPGLELCEHLPRLATQSHHVLQVRSMRHTEVVHDPAVYQSLTGYKHVSSAGGLKVEETDLPHWGSSLALADDRESVLPKFIQTPDSMKMEARVLPGQNAGVLPASFDPWNVEVTRAGDVVPPDFGRLDDASPARLAERLQLLRDFNYGHDQFPRLAEIERLDRFREQARGLVTSRAAREAFDLERESAETRDRYGRHRHGQSVLLARRLVEAGCRLVTVYWGNEDQDWADGKGPRLANNPWDTHRNHFPLCKDSLLPRADQTFAALLDDLHQRGLLQDTLVVWMGEFGRTPQISRPFASRDHWPHAYTLLLAGAGVKGGATYGRTDRWAAEVDESPVSPADLTATMLATLGVEPRQRVTDRRGRPHQLSTGRIQHDWFS